MTPSTVVVTRKGPNLYGANAPAIGLFDLPVRIDDQGVEWVNADGYGRWLGYARPRAVRDLADRLIETEVLEPSEVCRTVRQTSASGGRPTNELWFTRRGALIVAARAETKRATEVLHGMVDLVLAVRDLAFPRLTADASRQLVAENATLRARAADIDRAFTTGTIPSLTERVSILARIVDIARLKTGLTGGREFNRACSALHNDVKRAVGFQGKWSQLPIGMLGRVSAAIDAEQHRVRRDARLRVVARQLPLRLLRGSGPGSVG